VQLNPDSLAIRAKFGGDYVATDRTFRLGIDRRIAKCIAQRFQGRTVLETCTGAGFTTIALAEVAAHVVTIEIDPAHCAQARANLTTAKLLDRVTLVEGNALSEDVLNQAQGVNAAFLDPDWAVTGPDHVYSFRQSNMSPPADTLLRTVLHRTEHVALILPPFIDLREIEDLPPHELQRLYLGDDLALYCVYLGDLAAAPGQTELHV
jgi:16S rRNA G966 N2-methylase RsmD